MTEPPCTEFLLVLWTVPKYRSTSVYTSSYIRHHTVQYGAQSLALAQCSRFRRVSRRVGVAHRFGRDKLYICLNNKCFKLHPVYSLCTDIRPSQDHRILRMQPVRINLALGKYANYVVPWIIFEVFTNYMKMPIVFTT